MPRAAKSQGLSRWIERTIVLPDVVAAPGPIRLAPPMRAIADAIGDPAIERVSVLKSARIGFSTVLTAAIGYHVLTDPCPVLVLLPTQDDCRDYVVSEVERIFESSPRLRKKLSGPKAGGDRINRNTLTHRLFRGGDLKVVAGKAPRNLRRHTARILLVDESDAIEASAEGDAITLAERRTLSFADRKIIAGGTPLDESTSAITRLYRQSDQRIFELPCPECGAFAEITWEAIEWPSGRPELAAWRCPHCEALVDETRKSAMIGRGRWRMTAPNVKGHAGFRVNALASTLSNAAWGKLAAEYERAKDDTDTLRVFHNTILGRPWTEEGDEVDLAALAGRVEGFDLDHVPADVLAVTVGADCQDDRIECSIFGHGKDGTVFVLAHVTVWGSPLDDDTLAALDDLLKARWPHPLGGALKVDAAVIDAGDGGHYDAILKFSNARLSRRVLAGKGAAGFARPMIAPAKTKKGRLFIVGVDAIKAQIIARLARGRSIRFSHALTETYFEQLASERRIVRMARGRPVARFERKPGARAEALDCMTYGLAARAALTLNAAAFSAREDALRAPTLPKAPPPVIRSQWMDR
jgi:phage terminase large subunit GpA-like protein